MDQEESFAQSTRELLTEYVESELPFKPVAEGPTSNCESRHSCLFIENPKSKNLEKKITVKLPAKNTAQFVVVMKAPRVKKLDIVSALTITHLTDSRRPRLRVEKKISKDDVIRSQQRVISSLKVMVVGKLENPMLYCCKAMVEDKSNQLVIPLAVKRGEPTHKYKLPFKLSNAMEAEFEFIFIKSSKPKNCGETEEKQVEVFECMSFFCQPNLLPVNHESPAILNVQLKVDNEKLDRLPPEQLKLHLTKLLIARVKGTNLLQSFYVTLRVID